MIADVVIRGGAVWERPGCTALAIQSGRIVAIGSDDAVVDLIGNRTRVLEAAGGSILPGFQDAHVHPPMGGLGMAMCDLLETLDPDSVIAAITEHLATLDKDEWFLGAGWEPSSLGDQLDRVLLDRLLGDRPAFVSAAGRHDAWVNTRALELAGIDETTPDPPFGRLGRRADGSLSGVLHEAAVDLVERVAPQRTVQDMERALLQAQQHLHSLGITAWQDAWTTPLVLAAYKGLAKRGELTARVTTALWWERDLGDGQIPGFVESRRTSAIGRLKATSVKIMVDGTTGNFSAAVLEPYLDDDGLPTCTCGTLFLAPEDLKSAVAQLDALGFQVHFHAIGERAVREALDAIENARRLNGPSHARHHIAHVCLVHPADVSRFAELDVTVNMQPYWAETNPEMVREGRLLGEERNKWWYPFESLRSAGARLSAGSDWPVSTADPLLGIYVAVNRIDPATTDPDREVFLPNERLTLHDAVAAYTSGSAYVNALEESTGELRIGALGDVAVLDRVLDLEVPTELGRVVLTLVEGDVVYDAQAVDA
ncbi:MAG: amidohydrolase [Marmoricola sp.]|nr:amidohydrolase [Marmoricola sp.]